MNTLKKKMKVLYENQLIPIPFFLSDLNFTKMFLMTYQSFTTPESLFDKLRERYDVPPPPEDTEDEEEWMEKKVF